MLLSLFLLVIFLFLTYALYYSIKTKKIDWGYGESMLVRYKENRVGFIVMFLFYVGLWYLVDRSLRVSGKSIDILAGESI